MRVYTSIYREGEVYSRYYFFINYVYCKYLILTYFYSFLLAIPKAYGSSWARDQIWATYAAYIIAVALPDPQTHCARLGIELAMPETSWIVNPLHYRGNSLPSFFMVSLDCLFLAIPKAHGSCLARDWAQPQQSPKPVQWQGWILNPLHHKTAPFMVFWWIEFLV